MKSRSSHTVVQRLSIGPVTHLRISGVIDETFLPQNLSSDMVGSTIVDLGRVERISSFGVRKWIEFTSKLPEGVTGLYIIHAPPLVVDQLNMVEGFAGVASVLSVLAPYTCSSCNEDRVRVVDVKEDRPTIAEGKAPSHSCPVCATALSFADQPSEFFDYLRHQPAPQVDATISRYLRTLQPAAPTEVVSHVKLVKDDITFIRVASVLRGDLNVRRLAAGLEGRVAYDLGNVGALEPEAIPKLAQVLETASQSAQVFLWRAPPAVLLALAGLNRTFKVGLLTLWLPCECRNCGNKLSQRIPAASYAQDLKSEKKIGGTCQVCGGAASVPVMRDVMDFLLAHAAHNPALEDDLEVLEPRALSQYLAGAAAHDEQQQAKSDESDSTGGLGSSLRLQVLRRLGQGGMAEVFLARQVGLKGFEKYVVVKKVLEHFAQSPEFVEMLFAEARANARLTHQNIVQTYDVGVMDGIAYITMEYVRGPDMKKLMVLLRRAGIRLPMQHALRVVAETAAGLHYAHSYVDPTGKPHPVVHRDVSPHNILVSLDGAIKLSDFGIAKAQGESENTRPGTLKGKIAYVSPEAIACQPLDSRSDVFSLGVVLFELLTGTLPFRRESEAAVLRAIMQEPAPNPSQLNPEIPGDISALILRSIEKDPNRRVQTAGQLREEIEAAMVRNQLVCSPTAVASFFSDKLKEALADFAPPTQSSSISGVTPGPGPGPTPAPVPVSPPPTAARPPTDTDFTEIHFEMPQLDLPPRQVPSGRPGDNVTRAGVEVPARPGPGSPPRKTENRARPPVPDTPSPPPSSLRTGEPKTVAAAPHAMSARAAVREPAVKEPVRPEEPRRSGNRKPRPRTDSSTRKAYLKSIIGGVSVGAIASLLVALGVRSSTADRLEVRNLAPEEQVYLFGVRVDPANLRAEGPDPMLISTARGGKIYRFGSAQRAQGLDLQRLVLAGTLSESERATLKVRTDPPGCEVELDKEKLDRRTPVEAAVPVGRELQLTVLCPRRPAWSRWVMATPGQGIDILVPVSDR